ncbi:15859_t:CDS:2 [Rhizophagus irregularis]|nr:15859_t:CDS:2 [Rhizophagus irregularis]
MFDFLESSILALKEVKESGKDKELLMRWVLWRNPQKTFVIRTQWYNLDSINFKILANWMGPQSVEILGWNNNERRGGPQMFASSYEDIIEIGRYLVENQ